jgi:FtsP/CotA-like multicopper oxidase with cupredoxin domain
MVVHLHGARSTEESDGYPEAWYLPVARNIPERYATVGTFYNQLRDTFESRCKTEWKPGTAPGFFGNTMVVNGDTWPVLKVEQRRYRLRFLNGCNARFLILKIAANPTQRPGKVALPIWQVGSDGGFLPRPVPLEQVLIAIGQRIGSIVDFTDVPVGTEQGTNHISSVPNLHTLAKT